jgi:prepilin-type N-terminal cleavage/methylation domain-containing protein
MSTKRSAFTLVEMLITLTIFSVVAVLSVTLLVTGLRSARKIQAQVLLYSEAQALMDQMARDVERNTVDYEAYYARDVRNDLGWNTPDYGKYAQSFYNPGTGGTEAGPYDGVNMYGSYYQANCSDGSGTYPTDCPTGEPVSAEQDTETGAHPFTGIDAYSGYAGGQDTMNAFCESADGSTDCTSSAFALQDNLILVNGDGDSRTVYALKPFSSGSSDYYMSKMGLSATDTNNDGIVDLWGCSTHYSGLCTGTYTNANGDIASVPTDVNDFVALTPDALTIEDFKILVNPSEDPYRAFAEGDEQVQPQVTIILKVSLSSDYSSGLLGEVPSILIQRTISTGVYSKVPSY